MCWFDINYLEKNKDCGCKKTHLNGVIQSRRSNKITPSSGSSYLYS